MDLSPTVLPVSKLSKHLVFWDYKARFAPAVAAVFQDIVREMPSGLMAATLLALLITPPSAADERAVDLRWDAPARCPGEAVLRKKVNHILKGSLDLPRPRPLSVIGVVRDEKETLSLRVFTVSEGVMRERLLRHNRDCELLTRAAAVVIAITIDPASFGGLSQEALTLLDEAPALAAPEVPTAAVEPPTTAAPKSPPEVAVVEPVSVAPREPAIESTAVLRPAPAAPAVFRRSPRPPQPTTKWRPRGAVRMLGGVGIGELPRVGGGASGTVALVFQYLRVELVASFWPARRLRINGTAMDTGGDFLLWSLGPRVCGVLHPHHRLEVPLCAGVEAGRVHVAGVGLEGSRRTQVTWIAGVVAPSLVVVPLRRMALWLAPELLVPSRATYSIEGIGPVYRTQPVAGRVMAGIELRFP